MADIADVFDAIGAIIQGVVYPNGTGQPSSVIVDGSPVTVRIYPGWPIPAQLDADLAAGIATISMYTPANMWRNTTRYEAKWRTSFIPAKPVSIAATTTTLTLAGVPAAGLNIAALLNGRATVYTVQAGDTLAFIAAALAFQINATITPASAVGAVITVPNARNLIGRVGTTGTAIREVLRQEQRFQVTCWCPPPTNASLPPDLIRRTLMPPIKLALAATEFLTMASDNTAAWIVTAGDYLNDDAQKPNLYRRDLFYSIEYGTTQTMTATEIVVAGITYQLPGPTTLGPLVS